MSRTVVIPPQAAACDPVSKSSLYSSADRPPPLIAQSTRGGHPWRAAPGSRLTRVWIRPVRYNGYLDDRTAADRPHPRPPLLAAPLRRATARALAIRPDRHRRPYPR